MDYKTTITIPSSRIYLDSLNEEEARRLLLTFTGFNEMKEWAYNRLYDSKFLKTGQWDASARIKEELKKRYPGIKVPDYYVTSIYSTASGMVSSQKELSSIYKEENSARIQHALSKIGKDEKTLAHFRKVKEAIIKYCRALKNGKKRLPTIKRYKDVFPELCPVKNNDGLYDGKALYDFEILVDRQIKTLGTRIAQIKHKVSRMEEKDFSVPRRVTFGGRAAYKLKDTVALTPAQTAAWHRDRDYRRNSIIHISGRHDSPDGNWCCRYKPAEKQLILMCWDGKDICFEDVKFPYRGEELARNLTLTKDHGRADIVSVGYTLEIHLDSNGRAYMLVKASFEVTFERLNDCTVNGIVSVDLNYDNIALSETNKDGCRVGRKVLTFDLLSGKSGHNKDLLGRVCAEVARYCRDKKKPLVMEDVNTQKAKTKMAYGSKKGNAHASIFAFRTMTAFLLGKCASYGVGVIMVNPAYTSKAGMMKYMMLMRCTIHEAASYVIGRRGMGFLEKIPSYLRGISPGYSRDKPRWNQEFTVWRSVTSKIGKYPRNIFYRRHPDCSGMGYFRELLENT